MTTWVSACNQVTTQDMVINCNKYQWRHNLKFKERDYCLPGFTDKSNARQAAFHVLHVLTTRLQFQLKRIRSCSLYEASSTISLFKLGLTTTKVFLINHLPKFIKNIMKHF